MSKIKTKKHSLYFDGMYWKDKKTYLQWLINCTNIKINFENLRRNVK